MHTRPFRRPTFRHAPSSVALGPLLRAFCSQQFKANEVQSGGAGADEGEDGTPVDAIHAFEFMGGRVATMIWEDGVRLRGGDCLLYTSPSPRDGLLSRMPSSA